MCAHFHLLQHPHAKIGENFGIDIPYRFVHDFNAHDYSLFLSQNVLIHSKLAFAAFVAFVAFAVCAL